MPELNKKFTIEMRRHIINECLSLIALGGGFTKHKHDALDSEASVIMGCNVMLNCDSVMKPRGTPRDQLIARVWRFRRNEAIGLALKMGLIKSEQFIVKIAGSSITTSRYAISKRGGRFEKLPNLAQRALISLFVAGSRFANTSTRFKRITGLIGLITLAFKIWHSGLPSAAWIGASALVMLVIAFVAGLWNGKGMM